MGCVWATWQLPGAVRSRPAAAARLERACCVLHGARAGRGVRLAWTRAAVRASAIGSMCRLYACTAIHKGPPGVGCGAHLALELALVAQHRLHR
jgi:hypothetical protein